MSSKPAKIEEYRRLAHDAAIAAQDSGLDHVRAKHAMASQQWTALAMLEEERATPALHLFRVSSHAGIWCVIRNGAFFGNHASQADAIAAAQAAAVQARASGQSVKVYLP